MKHQSLYNLLCSKQARNIPGYTVLFRAGQILVAICSPLALLAPPLCCNCKAERGIMTWKRACSPSLHVLDTGTILHCYSNPSFNGTKLQWILLFIYPITSFSTSDSLASSFRVDCCAGVRCIVTWSWGWVVSVSWWGRGCSGIWVFVEAASYVITKWDSTNKLLWCRVTIGGTGKSVVCTTTNPLWRCLLSLFSPFLSLFWDA